jgi:hypothetical protein
VSIFKQLLTGSASENSSALNADRKYFELVDRRQSVNRKKVRFPKSLGWGKKKRPGKAGLWGAGGT